MRPLDVTLVTVILRFYPRTFRARFAEELLCAYLDQRDALARAHPRARGTLSRHAIRTIAGLLLSLLAVHRQERRRTKQFASYRSSRSTPVSTVAKDISGAARLLRAQPGFAAVAILTLALGIGANTAVFSVLNGVILSQLPYDEPERLVRLYTTSTEDPARREYLTGLDILDVRAELKAFASLGIGYTYREVGGDLAPPGRPPQRIRVMPVNAEYFTTLRATPLMGRTFTREEERIAVRRIVLSNGLWRSVTGSDPNVIGRSVEMNGESYEVVGVMRATFLDVVAGEVAAWTPANLQRSGSNSRNNHYLTAIARLAPGVTLAQAQSQVDALMLRLASEFPDSHKSRRLRVVPLREDVIGDSGSTVYVLMGAAGLVLLIACLNVANLFVARSVSRSRETAIRTALGAGRSRLMVERLSESVVVAIVGGTVGSAVAYWGVKILLSVSPDSLPRSESIGFDPILLSFSIVVTVLTGVLFGAWPAFRASRVAPSEALHEGSRGNFGGRGARKARAMLVASQVSIAVILLVGAGILLRSFAARQQVDLGFSPENVATFEVHLPEARYGSPEDRIRFHNEYQEGLRAVPGVQRVGVTSWLPANGAYHYWGYGYLDAAGERQWAGAQVRVVDGDFFEALDIRLLKGRRFSETDGLDTTDVGLISESLARKIYGNASPLGQEGRAGSATFTIVGVVEDVAYEANGNNVEMVYLSHDEFADNRNWALTYVIKTGATPMVIMEPSRRALAAIDPALVLYRPRTMEAVLARHRSQARFTLLLMVTFATIALSLAAVGVYGVLSFAVTQRTHEIGVRLALGARPAHLRLMVVRQGLAVAGVGMLCGLAGALALSRVLVSLAFGVSTRDPWIFATVAALLAAVVVAAGYTPARRATRVNPLESLRSG